MDRNKHSLVGSREICPDFDYEELARMNGLIDIMLNKIERPEQERTERLGDLERLNKIDDVRGQLYDEPEERKKDHDVLLTIGQHAL